MNGELLPYTFYTILNTMNSIHSLYRSLCTLFEGHQCARCGIHIHNILSNLLVVSCSSSLFGLSLTASLVLNILSHSCSSERSCVRRTHPNIQTSHTPLKHCIPTINPIFSTSQHPIIPLNLHPISSLSPFSV